jgi:carboxyl-terminal processing protease
VLNDSRPGKGAGTGGASDAGVARGRRSLRVALTATALAATLVTGIGLERFVLEQSAVGSQRHEELTDLDAFETLEQTYDLIREEYVLSDDISDEDLIYGASLGMMEALGDENHSTFLNPDEAEDYYESLAGTEFVGIGISIDTTVNPPVVIMPIANSPALEAGILPGDQILAIDGVPTSSFEDSDAAVDTISGEAGSEVTLEVLHAGETESIEVTVTRASIDREAVDWAMLPDNVLWIRVNTFYEGSGEGVVNALEEGKRLGAEGVILDLRANPGGLIVEELEIVSQFLPKGSVVFQSQDADGNIEEYTVTDSEGAWREEPLVVLVNGDSVSAAEVSAAAIAGNNRGITIGETTFGTGTSLAFIDLEDGSLLMMGVEMWLTPSGEAIWHKGLEPMVNVVNDPAAVFALPYQFEGNELTEEQLAGSGDEQLIAAFEVISGQIEENAG